jgi:hypothetical protein
VRPGHRLGTLRGEAVDQLVDRVDHDQLLPLLTAETVDLLVADGDVELLALRLQHAPAPTLTLQH